MKMLTNVNTRKGEGMREIKFRAWDKENNRMVYPEDIGICFDFVGNEMKVFDVSEQMEYGTFPLLYCEIMQYTRLHDKNDKEIYEGDVLFVRDEEDCSGQMDTGVGEVEFIDGLWYVSGNVQNGLYDLDKFRNFEVIGNIYENPKLLEV